MSRSANRALDLFGQQSAVRKIGKCIVKGCMPKMVFALLQIAADMFLLGNMPAEFCYVNLALLGTFSFSFGSSMFRHFYLCGSDSQIFQEFIIGKIDNAHDRNARHKRVEAPRVDEIQDSAGCARSRKVSDGGPKIVPIPRL